jgi:hypothetical protein
MNIWSGLKQADLRNAVLIGTVDVGDCEQSTGMRRREPFCALCLCVR